MTKDDTITLPRSVVEQALECLEDNISYDFNGNPYEEADWLMQAAAINLSAALDQPQSKHEPVSWIENFGGSVSYGPIHGAARKLPEGVRFDLYTSPQPPRQPLTRQQIQNIVMEVCDTIYQQDHTSYSEADSFSTGRSSTPSSAPTASGVRHEQRKHHPHGA